MIHKCALAVITNKGHRVEPPTVAPLDEDEERFLDRHVDKLREYAQSETAALGRFRTGFTTEQDLKTALTADNDAFTTVAAILVDNLAATMKGTPNASDCVAAFLVHGTSAPDACTLLKLDAAIEGARLRRRGGVIRLSVYQDLLPRPGKLQKGFSWPDPRPDSSVIIRDHGGGEAARYFLNAFGIDGSPSSVQTEKAMVAEIATLPAIERGKAIAAAQEGGPADVIVTHIQEQAPSFISESPALGAGGALAGHVRPGRVTSTYVPYETDGIKLQVRVDKLEQVLTVAEGDGYVTTIRTDTPLTPVTDERPNTAS